MIGGHSFGGRVASMLAAADAPGVRGLVLLSYPLHRPGIPTTSASNTGRTSAARFSSSAGMPTPSRASRLLRQSVARIPGAELVVYRRVGHGLGNSLDDALDQLAAFVQRLSP